MSTFHLIAVDRDNDAYYVTRWDRATPIEVEANTRDEAFDALWKILGEAPRGRHWVARLKKVTAAKGARS